MPNQKPSSPTVDSPYDQELKFRLKFNHEKDQLKNQLEADLKKEI